MAGPHHPPPRASPHSLAGIFIPTLGIGAAAGRLAGRGVQAAVTACGYSLQVRCNCMSACGGGEGTACCCAALASAAARLRI